MSGDNFGRMTEHDWDIKTGALQSAFGETVSYLRSSHKGPEILEGNKIIPAIQDGDDEIDEFMKNEINKYNRLKR